jgi:hypothetical protein
MVEALVALRALRRREALDDYRHRCLMWAVTAPWVKKAAPPPELPPLLRE